MNFMWLLIGIVVVAVISTAREIIKGWRHKLSESMVPLPSPHFHSLGAFRPSTIPKRQVKRISMTECGRLIQTSDNIVFISVREGSEGKRLPFPEMHVMSIAPNELVDVLKLIPESCVVVLWGEVELCSSILGSLADAAGSVPVYVLEATAAHSAAS